MTNELRVAEMTERYNTPVFVLQISSFFGLRHSLFVIYKVVARLLTPKTVQD
ncbi:MAG: hypothetical protein WCE87_06875 [Candidatus Udaeobacter sp.]